jgi:hypothetical protein
LLCESQQVYLLTFNAEGTIPRIYRSGRLDLPVYNIKATKKCKWIKPLNGFIRVDVDASFDEYTLTGIT